MRVLLATHGSLEARGPEDGSEIRAVAEAGQLFSEFTPVDV